MPERATKRSGRACLTFQGLEHRLEYVGEYQGIHFYNDSIATIPEAAIAAVKSLPETDTMILGGYDRMLDYSALIDFLVQSGVRNFIFLGKAGLRIYDGFQAIGKTNKNLFLAGSMEEACALAFSRLQRARFAFYRRQLLLTIVLKTLRNADVYLKK